MNMSEEKGELFKAFSKFQGELENASKDKQGHGYKYADLAECINTAKPVLARNGLAVSQLLGTNQEGKQTLITMLTHESGQYISSEFVMVEATLMGGAGKNPAQVLGSAISYQRRYSYAAIIGLAQEDSDAHGLQRPPAKPKMISHDEILKQFTQFASSADMDSLKSEFSKAWSALKGTPQQQKSKEIYDTRRDELQGINHG